MPLLTSTQARPLAAPEDFPALLEFYHRCDQVDRRDDVPTLEMLQHRYNHPPPTGELRQQLWETDDGHLVGVVALWLRLTPEEPEARLSIKVHPDYRGHRLEAELFAWAETAIQEKAALVEKTVAVQINTRQGDAYYQELYICQGYHAVRWFYDMQRPLSEPIPMPQLPPGFTTRQTTADEAAAWVEMFNQTFVDHWNFHAMTVADRQYRLHYPTHQPEFDWVAVAPDGRLAAFCYGNINQAENARKQCQEGWIFLVGTRRGFRRRGLARAMLLQGIHQLQTAGMETALLGVDAQNPNQAQSLYESVGFRVKETYVTYEKWL
jgi:mycothiol synthase